MSGRGGTSRFHFVDQVGREAKTLAGIEGITANSYTVRSTINVPLQRAVEQTLQEGLWRYERSAGRSRFVRAEANLAKAIQAIEGDPKKAADKRPALAEGPDRPRGCRSTTSTGRRAIVVEKPGRKNETWRVGLADGRIMPLSADGSIQSKLKLSDVVLVKVTEAKGKAARAEIRVRPSVQGTVVVLENKTGRVLAMAGGFSYPLSQLNRATQAQRQPGSAIKPLSYLAALRRLQPNTYVSDDSITLPPIGVGHGRAREQDYWTPRNYDGGGGGILTLRRALENSRNLATVHLLDGGIDRHAGSEPRSAVRARAGGANLQGMRQILPVRAGRAAGAADRPRGLLRGDCQRGRPAGAAPGRFDRAQRPDGLSPRSQAGDRHRLGRSRRVLSAQDHDAGRAEPRHRAHRSPSLAPVCGRQDRHLRRVPTTPGSSASPTTSRSRSGSDTTTPAASGARSAAAPPAAASRCRSSSRSSRRCGPITRRRWRSRRRRRRPSGRWPARRSRSSASTSRMQQPGPQPGQCHRVLPNRPHRPYHRYPVPAGVA